MAKRILSRLLGIIVILGIIYTGASWYIGQRAEALIHNRVDVLNQQLQYELPAAVQANLSIVAYKRHVFSSDVSYTLTLASNGETRTLRLANHLVHGPFPYTEVMRGNLRPLLVASNARLLPSADTQAIFAARTDMNAPPLTVRTVLTFWGGGQSVWYFQPLTLEPGMLAFDGGQVIVTLSNSFQDGTLQAEFAGLHIDGGNVAVRVQDIAIKGASAVSANGTQSSRGRINIGLLTYHGADGIRQQAKNTHLSFSGSLAQGLVAGQLAYSVGHQQAGQLDLGSIDLQAHVADIDLYAVQTLQQLAAARAAGDNPPARQSRQRAAINALLAAQPAIAIDKLHWQVPTGTSDLALNLHLSSPDTNARLPLSMLLAEAVERGELNMTLSKPMLAAVLKHSLVRAGMDAQASTMRAQALINAGAEKLGRTGLFINTDDVVKTVISYRNQAFDVNGKQLSTAEFIAKLFTLSMGLR